MFFFKSRTGWGDARAGRFHFRRRPAGWPALVTGWLSPGENSLFAHGERGKRSTVYAPVEVGNRE